MRTIGTPKDALRTHQENFVMARDARLTLALAQATTRTRCQAPTRGGQPCPRPTNFVVSFEIVFSNNYGANEKLSMPDLWKSG